MNLAAARSKRQGHLFGIKSVGRFRLASINHLKIPFNKPAARKLSVAASLGVATILLVVCPMSAQTAADNSKVQPSDIRIKKTIRLVEVGVIAKDKKGRPLADLAASDFSIKDDGHIQKIRFFSMQQQDKPVTQTAEQTAQKSSPPSSAVFSNTHADNAGPVVILMDTLNTPWENQTAMKSALVQSLRRIHSHAPIALLTLDTELKMVSDFTSDTNSLAALLEKPAVAHQEGTGPAITAPKSSNKKFNDVILRTALRSFNLQMANQVDRTVAALNLIRAQFSLMQGRKSLIWIGGGLAVGPHDWPQVRDIIEQLNDANVGVYTVDARGVVLDYGIGADVDEQDMLGPWKEDQADTRGDILDAIAHNTGGVAYRNTNALDQAINRAVEDTNTVYTLGFYPQANGWDGRVHKLEVKVSRAGVTLRYRSEYRASAEAKSEPGDQQRMLQEIAASPIDFPGIRFGVQIQGGDTKPDEVKLALHIPATELRLSSQGDKSAAALQLLFIQKEPSGKDIATKTSSFTFQLSPSDFENAIANGITFTSELKLKPTAARVRVLVRDLTSGRIGSVDVTLALDRHAQSPPD